MSSGSRLTPALHPGAAYESFRQLLQQVRELEAVMVVGHNPNMSQFLSLLVTGGVSDRAIDMKKGSVARVEVGPKRGSAQLDDHSAADQERLYFCASQFAAKDLREIVTFLLQRP